MTDSPLLIQYHSLNDSNYKDAWDFQKILHNEIKSQKSKPSKVKTNFLNHLVFCEHNPVITMGKSGKDFHLKSKKESLLKDDIDYYDINRGGDITFHGPGQVTGYLIMDLELLYRDVHRFVRTIEESIIQLLKQYDIDAFRMEGFTGVWLGNESSQKRKICAIGVHLSRWVSMHGFALNVNTDLDYYNHIIPCGIDDGNKGVTSLSKELGKDVDIEALKHKLKAIIAKQYSAIIV